MTRMIQSLEQILDLFDVAVLDQWGVLHDGSVPYPRAIDAMKMLARNDKTILVVSNSGKRSSLNRDRIDQIGLPVDTIARVITSGETLWEDLNQRRLEISGRPIKTIYPICGSANDAQQWAANCSHFTLSNSFDRSVDIILLMGIADQTPIDAYDDVFRTALDFKTSLVCSNPDKKAPRDNGLVMSPGALADRFHQMGGEVLWYGKPHANIYRACQRIAPHISSERFLMVGDSIEHDISGAQAMGFASAFVRNGIHANDFENASDESQIGMICDRLAGHADIRPPDFSLQFLA